jgi:S-adenosylmethionine:tRNA ribosyltransferase-isomerase
VQTTISKENQTPDLFELQAYHYELPADRIAQYPVTPRDGSKLLVVHRTRRAFSDHHFRDLPDLLEAGDLIVLNETKVLPARFETSNGEVLLVRHIEACRPRPECWDAIVYPGKNFKPGSKLQFPGGISATVLRQTRIGRLIEIHGDVNQLFESSGRMPLPPYIQRDQRPEDRTRYQTIFAKTPGSIAAPTAGLHFTRRTFAALRAKQIEVARLTLHVGPGTFRPVKHENIRQHQIDPELYECSSRVWKKIQNASRVIAVGTTVTRALETIYSTGKLQGETDLFIYPGYRFHAIQGLITNFHLPRSSLLMLVGAFADYDLIREAYHHAIDQAYRFYSYGDAMLIL